MLIPILYLKGISTGDFEEALAALLGKDAGGLSASTIARLKDVWVDEHVRWSKRELTAKRYVYFWVDGIHVQARLEDAAQCLLVIFGEGVRRSGRRRPREHAILEGDAPRSETTTKDPRPTLLGAQDRQCIEQVAEEPTRKGQARIGGYLDG